MSQPPSPPPSIRMAEVLAALSLATDLGTGKPMGHALRACYLGMRMAGVLRLSLAEQAELYYSFLLMHSGCASLSLGLAPVIQGNEIAAIGDITLRDDTDLLAMLDWMRLHVSPDAPLPNRAVNILRMLLHSGDIDEQGRGVCEVASRVAQRLGMPAGVRDAVHYYLERWDGKGPFRMKAGDIPQSARLLQVVLKVEAMNTMMGQQDAEAMALDQKGKAFDPHLADVFFEVARDPGLWRTLAKKDLWDELLELEPESPYRTISEAKLDDVALAVADFVDLKSPAAVGHSRETARIAEAIARRMGMPPSEVAEIRRAALVHHLGMVALPAKVLLPPDQLGEADLEKLRLHPYYTDRVLSRVPALAGAAAIAGMHHEHLDGTGYYRGLPGSDIPVGARILALAAEFQERLQAQPGQPDPDPKQVLQGMQAEVGAWFSQNCFDALQQELGFAASRPPPRQALPAGLTDREVEVLRLLATGLSNRQIARALVVSEKTVAHHLEHIYDKIGISSRAAAVFFAMEHELI